jgi:cell division septum initiation protein DivIVA
MNPAAILALLGDLYVQIEALQKENEDLKAKLVETEKQEPEFPRKADPSDFVYDALGGPEEAAAQAREEVEGKS